MEEMKAIFTKSFEINSFLVNPQGKLGLYALLNMLQDAAGSHAERLGHGFEEALQRKMFWVMTRQALAMTEWPPWRNTVDIKTWLRPIKGLFAEREFEISYGGKKIGTCITTFLPLHSETRKPIKSDAILAPDETKEAVTDLEATKIELVTDTDHLTSFQVRNSDIDMNLHVNNTKYAQWVLDSIPASSHSKFRLLQYEVNFLAETHVGDTISIDSKTSQLFDPLVIQFQGTRQADKKPVFVSRIRAVPS